MKPTQRKEPGRFAVARTADFLATVARAARPSAALSLMADGFVDKLGARAAHVYRLPGERESLVLAASRSMESSPALGESPPPSWSPLADAARTRELQFSAFPHPANHQFCAGAYEPAGATVVLPLCCADRVLGAIAASFPQVLSPIECETLAHVADVLGGLLEGLAARTGAPGAPIQRVAELEASARRRDEWTHTLAYELRLLLINIVLLAGQLARTQGEEGKPAPLRLLLDHADRFNELVRQLLDVSKGDQALGIERRRGDLVACVQRCIDQRRWSELVRLRCCNAIPELWFDHQRIADVLVNLIANAQRNDLRAPVELVIERTATEVEVAVTRTGSPSLVLGEPSMEIYSGSSGLVDEAASVGIDICRVLIEAHGGRFWVESRRDGTSFRFSLPAGDLV